jgi:hypothetical protein
MKIDPFFSDRCLRLDHGSPFPFFLPFNFLILIFFYGFIDMGSFKRVLFEMCELLLPFCNPTVRHGATQGGTNETARFRKQLIRRV